MLFAEAVSIPGELLALILLVFLVMFLAAATVVLGTIVAARRCARTGSLGSRVVAGVGVSIELLVLVVATAAGSTEVMGLAGAALAGAAVAYTTATRQPVAP